MSIPPPPPESRASSPAAEILALCADLGFAAAGLCSAAPTAYRDELIAWLADGRHGSMRYLEEHLPARLDPRLVLPDARAAIMVADLYARRGDADPPIASGRGRIARYARGLDYHDVMKRRLHALCDHLRRLHPAHAFRAFVDTAPIAEREYAVRAGLGWTGKHTLLIAPPRPHSRGSYMLLGGILTTLDLAAPAAPTLHDHCGSCTRCIDACPTGAIAPYTVDARRCIAYLTIERREPIPTDLHAPIGDWLYGCDICQEVCPHNTPIAVPADNAAPRNEYESRFHGGSLDLRHILAWTDADRALALRGSAMKRATLAMLKRNALIVLANQALAPGATPGAREQLAQRCRDIAADRTQPPLLRETASQTLARLHP